MSRPKRTHEIEKINFQFFAISKMAKKQFLNWGKSLKLPKMQIHEFIFGFI